MHVRNNIYFAGFTKGFGGVGFASYSPGWSSFQACTNVKPDVKNAFVDYYISVEFYVDEKQTFICYLVQINV